MARVSLTELIDTVTESHRSADKIQSDWPPARVLQLVEKLDAMLTGAGVPGGDVEELTASLRTWLLSINDSAASVSRTAGSAAHCLEKARQLIRAAADAPAVFKLD